MHYSVPQFDAFLNVLISEDSFSSNVRAQIEARKIKIMENRTEKENEISLSKCQKKVSIFIFFEGELLRGTKNIKEKERERARRTTEIHKGS